jgi:hypothetical protein
MRLHILSDLHLEFKALTIPVTDADVVIFAGDVDKGDMGLDWIPKEFPDKPVIYVLYHEYYHGALPQLTDTLRRESAGTNVHVLENSLVKISDYTLLGFTLWTSSLSGPNREVAMRTAETLMNDYRIISNSIEQRKLRARDTAWLHRESVAWVRYELG